MALRLLIVATTRIERAVFARIAASLGHEVVGQAEDLASGATLAAAVDADVAIVDGRLPPAGGVAAIAPLRAAAPAMLVTIVAALGETSLVREAIAAGAAGAFRRPLLRGQVEATFRDLQAHLR